MHGRVNDRFSYVVGADGCGSSERADVGARLLTHNFVAALKRPALSGISYRDGLPEDGVGLQFCARYAADRTADQIRTWDGQLKDYLSTLLCVVHDCITGQVQAMIMGDGCLLFEDHNSGEMLFWQRSFSADMPCYPLYAASPRMLELYVDESAKIGNTESSAIFHKAAGAEWVEGDCSWSRLADGEFDGVCHEWMLEEGQPYTVSIFSDGVEKFHSGATDKDAVIPAQEVAAYLAQFPSRNGEFAKRRLIKRVRGQHYLNDDLFLASICIE